MKIEILECGDIKITSEKLTSGISYVIISEDDLIRMINESLEDGVFCDKDGNKKNIEELNSL